MTRILHCSDSHGQFPEFKGDFDIIVHSGDMLVNRVPRIAIDEHLFQRDYIRANGEKFKKWIGDKPFIFCAGNHDYAEPCKELRDLGINAINATNKVVKVNGIKFFGFPYVPYIGVWNWEAEPKAMQRKVKHMLQILEEEKVDVLIAHAPPYGVLDTSNTGQKIGNIGMTEALDEGRLYSKMYLTGHCHGFGGKVIKYKGKIISNAATTYQILDFVK